MTGLRAKNLKELLEHIKTVPGSVIYHHTHHFLIQHQYLSPEPPNDFAYWVTEVLNERELGERLASINTCEFTTIRALRNKIAETIEQFLNQKRGKFLKEADEGREFHFIKSISFIFPTPYTASNLKEFVSVLKKITIHSIYFHIFEARLRLEKETNDFSLWLETALEEKNLAKQIARLDPYTHTLEGLRDKIIRLIEAKLGKK
ncbi:MAG: hypothetical protein A3C35_06205 [Omnitrophica bacterium RIFCSPHIGHO2_02_FULL_46_11]|nr:MAG: hypothetical protein A3A81_02635 [Omnitrophica bacterium RIFCSPLOWO2_01_FULL_45_10b]OGW87872.1 MAG: hypothetical protein A3C35_06205 [Omnitrophica bacterium RIFCSPHIGHO2_02_FULL_46_11]